MSDKRTVLLLEDLPSWQETVRLLLENERGENEEELYEVVIADSLGTALTSLHSRVFDVAIVDICLVEGDLTNTEGMTFLDELGKYYSDDRTHAIMLSGHGTISLAVDAVKRPYVIDYVEKAPSLFSEDQFVSEVVRAWRLTEAQRSEHVQRRLHPLPSSLVKTFEIPRLVSALTPDLDAIAAARDLELLLDNLLLSTLPIAKDVHIAVDSAENTTNPSVHVLCWSRKLAKALDIAIGRTGSLDLLQPSMQWPGIRETGLKEKQWSVKYFDGIAFGLPDVSFEQFSQM